MKLPSKTFCCFVLFTTFYRNDSRSVAEIGILFLFMEILCRSFAPARPLCTELSGNALCTVSMLGVQEEVNRFCAPHYHH